jgi:hypothetical protein
LTIPPLPAVPNWNATILDITDGRSSSPLQPFHQVVASSFLEAEIEYRGAAESYFLKELRNGGESSFDLPVLRYRAMVHGIAAPWFMVPVTNGIATQSR